MKHEPTMEEQELLEMLKDYPVPEASAGYYDQALVRAAQQGTRRQRNRWLMTGFTIALEQEHTVRLVFASATALDSATLTVSLPEGIELAGFPGQREISWETSLQEGKNLLPLTLIALTPAGGELLARLEHEDRDRTFRLQVDVS
jgi:hypothetical protein